VLRGDVAKYDNRKWVVRYYITPRIDRARQSELRSHVERMRVARNTHFHSLLRITSKDRIIFHLTHKVSVITHSIMFRPCCVMIFFNFSDAIIASEILYMSLNAFSGPDFE